MTDRTLGRALTGLRDWVLEPHPERVTLQRSRESPPALSSHEPDAGRRRPIETFVAGLARGCGTTTVARGLAAALTGSERPARVVSLAAFGHHRNRGQARPDDYAAVLAHLAGSAMIVWDVGGADPRSIPSAGRGNRPLVMVAAGTSEPSLAELAAAMLARRSGRVLVAANRVREPERWAGRATVCLPESRIGAAIAVRGRRPPGRLGAAFADLAALLESGFP